MSDKPACVLWQGKLYDDEECKSWGPERRVVRSASGLIKVEALSADALGCNSWIESHSDGYRNEIEFLKQAVEALHELNDALTEAPEPPNV
jgi:hypothetical protein